MVGRGWWLGVVVYRYIECDVCKSRPVLFRGESREWRFGPPLVKSLRLDYFAILFLFFIFASREGGVGSELFCMVKGLYVVKGLWWVVRIGSVKVVACAVKKEGQERLSTGGGTDDAFSFCSGKCIRRSVAVLPRQKRSTAVCSLCVSAKRTSR